MTTHRHRSPEPLGRTRVSRYSPGNALLPQARMTICALWKTWFCGLRIGFGKPTRSRNRAMATSNPDRTRGPKATGANRAPDREWIAEVMEAEELHTPDEN